MDWLIFAGFSKSLCKLKIFKKEWWEFVQLCTPLSVFYPATRTSNLCGCKLCSLHLTGFAKRWRLVQRTRVRKSVGLHHMHYRVLCEKISCLGFAISLQRYFALSGKSRVVFQMPASPFSLAKLGDNLIPFLQFASSYPACFDRHTPSIKGSKLLFTLDCCMHFEPTSTEVQLLLFKAAKLREISLTRRLDGLYELAFWLESQQALTQQEAQAALDVQLPGDVPAALMAQSPIPDYVSIEVAA